MCLCNLRLLNVFAQPVVFTLVVDPFVHQCLMVRGSAYEYGSNITPKDTACRGPDHSRDAPVLQDSTSLTVTLL